jgi:hypothetical protein
LGRNDTRFARKLNVVANVKYAAERMPEEEGEDIRRGPGPQCFATAMQARQRTLRKIEFLQTTRCS